MRSNVRWHDPAVHWDAEEMRQWQQGKRIIRHVPYPKGAVYPYSSKRQDERNLRKAAKANVRAMMGPLSTLLCDLPDGLLEPEENWDGIKPGKARSYAE